MHMKISMRTTNYGMHNIAYAQTKLKVETKEKECDVTLGYKVSSNLLWTDEMNKRVLKHFYPTHCKAFAIN